MSRSPKKGNTPENRHRRRQRNKASETATPMQDSGGSSVLWTAVQSVGGKNWLIAAALVAAVFLAYQPAWHGGFIWDDDMHVTRPTLNSWDGLYRIWFEVGATLQYYPLLHSAFWIEHKLWGDSTLGYHLVNLFLHALSTLMVAVILRRLAIPGAFLAAAIFALHPVHVESVAWIAEQKNTLSGTFYLGAMLAYLRFDQTRKISLYLTAVGLFSLGMLCKTVIATLPGALLVIFWWQRGRLSWKKDVLPLVPFFLLGAGGGMITAWWELRINKCDGLEFVFTPAERLLIAGRAVWFHLWKLVWPARLTFIYPRWPINADAWLQYLFPFGAAALLAMLWAIRRRTRAPLAAALFFGGTLFPVLGFFNLYTFRYSLVANHYQYLASLGIIALASAGAAILLNHWRLWERWPAYCLCGALLMILSVLTARQSRMYSDIETLYRTTIAQNPNCWMAYNNLGILLMHRGQNDKAIETFQDALKIKPDYADPHNNIGMVLMSREQNDEAIKHFHDALKIKPDYAVAHNNLGIALMNRGQSDEAIEHFRDALTFKPDYADAHGNLMLALVGQGKIDAAMEHYREAVKLRLDNATTHVNFGLALISCARLDEAASEFQLALNIQPDCVKAHCGLAEILAKQGKIDEAIKHLQRAVEIQPDQAEIHSNLGLALASRGRLDEAIWHHQKAVQLKPDFAAGYSNYGIALARRGRIDDAMTQFQKALVLARQQNNQALVKAVMATMRLFQAGGPNRK